MRSTMMDAPLQVSRILEHGRTVHGASEVVTWTATEPRRTTYAEIGAQAARLAHALRDDLGVTGDQRVATFMWNNAEHLVAYLAVPSMGAVLHTLNLRLFPEQLAYIANHAEDRVVIVDTTLIPLLAKVLPQLTTVEHVVVVGDGDPSPLVRDGRDRAPLGRPARRQARHLRLARRRRARRRGAVLHVRHHRQPEGRRLLAPLDLPALDAGLHGRGVRPRPTSTRACRSCRCSTRWRGACRTPRSCPALADHAGPVPAGRADSPR